MLKPQEREALGAACEAHDPRLLGMQPQPERPEDRRHQLAGLIGLLLGRAQDHEVICILHQHPQPSPVGRPHLI
jgi:hypothetical protein